MSKMNISGIKIKLLSDKATIPTRGSIDSAGLDLYAALDEKILIQPFSTTAIPTDIAVEIPKGNFGGIFARSGIALKKGLRPANCTGVIDADYRGNVIVALHNDTAEIQEINPRDRIAQLIIMPYTIVDSIAVVGDLDDTARATNGFGSTGI